MIILPTLQKQIRHAFIRLVFLFGVLGLLLILAVFFTGRMPSVLVRMNYDSIAYAQSMEEAFNGIRFSLPEPTGISWQEEFEKALELEKGNITEEDEKDAVKNIQEAWTAFLTHSSPENAETLHKSISNLTKVNERGILKRLDESLRFRDIAVLLSAALFLVGIIWAFFLADSVSTRLSHPLRRAAEVFRNRPPLKEKLHLPEPQSLEIRILFDELSRLWKQLAELDALNVGKLITEKNKLEVILESAEDAVLVVENEKILHVSAKMLSLLNLPVEELLGHDWNDLSTNAHNYLTLRNTLHAHIQGVQELTLNIKEEESMYAARSRDLLSPKNQVIGQIYLLTNITEKRHRDTLRSEMMDWISHELKTPIQSLGLASDLLLKHKGTDSFDEDTQMLIDTVGYDAKRLRSVANQFMDIARMSPFALELRLENTDITQSLQLWLKSFSLMARETNIQLTVNIPDTKLYVMIDKERFEWVVANLMSNALRVCPPQSILWINLTADKENVLLAIEDNGPGISEELAQRLFLPYSHGRTAGTKQGLTGLGLAIAQGIVEAHAGIIQYQARSKEKGGGSVFTVSLPLSDYISGDTKEVLI